MEPLSPDNRAKARARFEAKFIPEPNSGCWLWLGSLGRRAEDGMGYGHMRVAGTSFAAHRLSWLLYEGPIPAGLCVCHKCDICSCVNPRHLFLGTHKENTADMIAKGRQGFDRRRPLTDDDLLFIANVRLRRKLGDTWRAIAQDFGVSYQAVQQRTNTIERRISEGLMEVAP